MRRDHFNFWQPARFLRLLPNLLTISRIVAAACLLVLPFRTAAFYIAYGYALCTDLADGPLARRLSCAGKAGAALDSAADFLLFLALAVRYAPALPWEGWMLIWIGAIALLRLASVVLNLIKFRHPALLHTLLNKLAGGALFTFPLLYPLAGLPFTAGALSTLATVSALEELAITLRSKTLERDTPGLLIKRFPHLHSKFNQWYKNNFPN